MFKRIFVTMILLVATALPVLAAPTNTSGPWGVLISKGSGYTSLVSALSSPTTAGKTVVIASPMAVSVDFVLPADRQIKFISGGRIDPAVGKTFDFNRQNPDAGTYQIFGGAGTVTGLSSESKPEWFLTNTIPGTTDMGTAINKAISASNNILLSKTTYHSTVSIQLRGDTVIRGAGGETIINISTAVDGFVNATPGTRIARVLLENFKLISSGTGNFGLNLDAVVYSIFRNLDIRTFASHGIYINDVSANYNTIDNCVIYANGGSGIYMNAGNSNANKVLNSVLSANAGWGVYLGDNIQSPRVENCSLEGNALGGIYLGSRGAFIVGNHIEGNGTDGTPMVYGIFVNDVVGTGFISHNFGAGNYFYGGSPLTQYATNFSGTDDAIGWFYGGRLANMTWQAYSDLSPIMTMGVGALLNIGRVVINDSSSAETRIQTTSSGSHAVTFIKAGGFRTDIKVNSANMNGLNIYANNAAALSGGKVAGDLYQTSTGQVMVVY